MSEADKMFESLEYDKVKEFQTISYRYVEEDSEISYYIDFVLLSQRVHLGAIDKDGNSLDEVPLTVEEIRAINKKCEELGWI